MVSTHCERGMHKVIIEGNRIRNVIVKWLGAFQSFWKLGQLCCHLCVNRDHTFLGTFGKEKVLIMQKK